MVEAELVSDVENECVHHWMIESPKGEASLGVCKICGARRDFFNSPETKFLRLSKDARAKTPETRAHGIAAPAAAITPPPSLSPPVA